MFNDVSDKQKARANLILASMGVILIIHGDGTFNGSSFLGGSITFGEELALPIAGSATFIYFVWRFLLSSGDAIREFAWDYNQCVYTSMTYINVLKDWLKTVSIPKDQVKRFTSESIFHLRIDSDGNFPPKISNIFFPIEIWYQNGLPDRSEYKPYFEYRSISLKVPFSTEANPISRNKVSFSNYLKLQKLVIRSFIKAIILKRAFTDVILPFLIGYYATVLLTYTVTEKFLSMQIVR